MIKLSEILFTKTSGYFTRLTILREGKLEDIKSKLSGTNLEMFNSIMAIQPKLPPKFWTWLTKHYNEKENRHVDAETLHNLLIEFEKIIQRGGIGLPSKDINSIEYSDIDKLESAVEKAKLVPSGVKAKKDSKSNANTIFVDDQYAVIQPTSVESACYYGAGTKWCISGRQENEFHNYASQGIKFVFIIDKTAVKTDPLAKVAIAMIGSPEDLDMNDGRLGDTYEIYDSQDNMRSIEDVWKRYPQNLVLAINKFFGKEEVPATPEAEQKRFAALPPAQAVKVLKTYVTTLETTLGNKEELGRNSDKIQYLTNTIKRCIENATPRQVSYFIGDMMTDDNFEEKISEGTKELIKNLLRAAAAKLTANMDGPQAMAYMIDSMHLLAHWIPQLNLIAVPEDFSSVTKIFSDNSLSSAYKMAVVTKNFENLAKAAGLDGHEVFFSPSTWDMFENTFNVIRQRSENEGDSFFDLDPQMQQAFEDRLRTAVKVDPKIYDYEDFAEKIWEFMSANRLIKATNSFGKTVVLFKV